MHFHEWNDIYFDSNFTENRFWESNWQKSQHWMRWWLGAEQATSHYLYQCWPSSRKYSALGGELNNTSSWYIFCLTNKFATYFIYIYIYMHRFAMAVSNVSQLNTLMQWMLPHPCHIAICGYDSTKWWKEGSKNDRTKSNSVSQRMHCSGLELYIELYSVWFF